MDIPPVLLKKIDENGCVEFETTHKYVPWIEGGIALFGEYGISNSSGIYFNSEEKSNESHMLILPIGENWGNESGIISSGEYSYTLKTTLSCDSVFDSKLIGGVVYEDVLFLKKTIKMSYLQLAGAGPVTDVYYYYAKNIGLVKYKAVFPTYTDEYELTDYYIAPH